MKRTLLILALTGWAGITSAQTAKTPSSAQATPKAVAAMVSTAAESEADKAGKTELVERVFSEQSYLYSQIIDKCFTFKMSPTCWPNSAIRPTPVTTRVLGQCATGAAT